MLKIFFVLILSLPGLVFSQTQSMTIATPVWEGYTNKDGTGFYHELFKAIYEPAGISLSFTYAPFNRSQQLLLKGNVDAIPAAYYEPERGTIFPKWHMGTDFISALYKESTIPEWKGEESIEGKIVAWVRGYKFSEFGVVNVDVNLHRVRTVESGLKMLERDRIDVLLDYASEISSTAERINMCIPCQFNFDNSLPGLKLYMEFGNTEKGKYLADIYDKGMERLYRQGQLQEWFLEYDGVAYERP